MTNYDDEFYMQQAIEFAKNKNPVWPFSSLIVNEKGPVILNV